jgi:hypothetical protein
VDHAALTHREVLAVDDSHRDRIEIEIIKQARVDRDHWVVESGLPVDQSGASEKVPQPQLAQK